MEREKISKSSKVLMRRNSVRIHLFVLWVRSGLTIRIIVFLADMLSKKELVMARDTFIYIARSEVCDKPK